VPPLPSSPAADFILKSPLSTFFHHLSLHHHAAGSAFLLALTPPSSSRCFRHCAQFIVAPPLPSSLHRKFCLCHCATVAFFVTPPFHSLSRRRFCLRHHAAASSEFRHAAVPFLVAPLVLPSSSRPRLFCICRCAAAAFLVAPLLLLSSRCHSLHRRAAALFFF
jgi:hypothetical protein